MRPAPSQPLGRSHARTPARWRSRADLDDRHRTAAARSARGQPHDVLLDVVTSTSAPDSRARAVMASISRWRILMVIAKRPPARRAASPRARVVEEMLRASRCRQTQTPSAAAPRSDRRCDESRMPALTFRRARHLGRATTEPCMPARAAHRRRARSVERLAKPPERQGSAHRRSLRAARPADRRPARAENAEIRRPEDAPCSRAATRPPGPPGTGWRHTTTAAPGTIRASM